MTWPTPAVWLRWDGAGIASALPAPPPVRPRSRRRRPALRLTAIVMRMFLCVSSMVYFLNKKTAKSKTNNIPTIDLSIMPSNKFFLTEWSNGEKFKTQLIQAQAGDLLFGSIRPYLKKAGIMPISGGVGQTVYLYTVTYEHNYNFCFCTLTSEDVFQHAITRSKGTRMPVIDSDELLSFQVPYNEQIVKKYNEIINIKQTMISLSQQTQTLTALRDFLLPLLMNGQASVR